MKRQFKQVTIVTSLYFWSDDCYRLFDAQPASSSDYNVQLMRSATGPSRELQPVEEISDLEKE